MSFRNKSNKLETLSNTSKIKKTGIVLLTLAYLALPKIVGKINEFKKKYFSNQIKISQTYQTSPINKLYLAPPPFGCSAGDDDDDFVPPKTDDDAKDNIYLPGNHDSITDDDTFYDDDSVTDDDTFYDDDTFLDDDTGDDDATPERMILVPAGDFWMGCEPDDTRCYPDELPRHQITLPSYYIDIFEVDNKKYAEFLNNHGNDCYGNECVNAYGPDTGIRMHKVGGIWSADIGYGNHPTIEVSWYGAKGFCEGEEKRLPTEAEWEKAAKGSVEHYIFPWNDTWIINASNSYHSGDPFDNGTTPVGYYDGSDHSGTYQTTDGRSPFGAHDMAGNTWEWINDWYDSNYYETSPTNDPQGPGTGVYRILHGGSFYYSLGCQRTSGRTGNFPDSTNFFTGFRCAKDQ